MRRWISIWSKGLAMSLAVAGTNTLWAQQSGEIRQGGITADPVLAAVENAHGELWRRFMDPHNLLYDYADRNGEVRVPTPEECREAKPNGLGWWSPIENGAFFSGLYLAGLVNRWRATGRTLHRNEARRVAQGLLRLSSVGRSPGFIARGVATDGSGFHPAGSDDQTLPWFYGLWHAVKSGLLDERQHEETVKAMVAVAEGLEANGWHMPCVPRSLGNRGSWAGASPSGAPRVLFVTRAMYDLTADKRWLEVYRRLMHEKPHKSEKTRLELCGDGTLIDQHSRPESDYFAFWTKANAQVSLNALCKLETDPAVRAHYERGRREFARAAAKHVARGWLFDNRDDLPFTPDWRQLDRLWRPQANPKEMVAVARPQLREWNRINPRLRYEARGVREPLFAAWIVVLAEDDKLTVGIRADVDAMLTRIDWTRLRWSSFFPAECLYWERRCHSLEQVEGLGQP